MSPTDPEVEKMREAARAVMKNAYCAYSGFPVGAAVVTDSGKIFVGSNVENASYGLTMCAERNAIFLAVAQGHRDLKAVVVVTPTETPTPPCGACRQVINEFNPDAEIFCFGEKDVVQQFTLSELLPRAFGPRNLGRK
ncbi:MAG: cytidine deaminase [Verrucomicrobiota bacterium]|jgi:cytidine deaminase